MRRITVLLLLISAAFHVLAQNNCLDKKLSEHFKYSFNNKEYGISTYYCANNEINNPTILKIQNHNYILQFTDLIGIKGMTKTGISNWNKKPVLYYFESSSTRSETYMTFFLRKNSLFVNCIFTKQRLKNLINSQYSFCDINKLISDGMDVVDLIPDFSLSTLFSNYDYSIADQSLENKNFDIFIGKIDDISFYQHFLSINDYLASKHKIIIASKAKQYQIKSSEVFQRMDAKGNFIGLDISINDEMKFYDKNDRVVILDEFFDNMHYLWLKVRYKNKNRIIEHWIKGDSLYPFNY